MQAKIANKENGNQIIDIGETPISTTTRNKLFLSNSAELHFADKDSQEFDVSAHL